MVFLYFLTYDFADEGFAFICMLLLQIPLEKSIYNTSEKENYLFKRNKSIA